MVIVSGGKSHEKPLLSTWDVFGIYLGNCLLTMCPPPVINWCVNQYNHHELVCYIYHKPSNSATEIGQLNAIYKIRDPSCTKPSYGLDVWCMYHKGYLVKVRNRPSFSHPLFSPPGHRTRYIQHSNTCTRWGPQDSYWLVVWNMNFMFHFTYPICSMYGIFTYIWLIYGVNVGKYSIHGAYGYGIILHIDFHIFQRAWNHQPG